jgi:hypothetical protein
MRFGHVALNVGQHGVPVQGGESKGGSA